MRTDFMRRQALVEIDVLTAMALNLTLDELLTIYHIQFPVLQAYEKDTYYDQQGRIVFTSNRGLTGVGLSREEWQDAKHLQTGTIEKQLIDGTLPSGPEERTITYHAPFDSCCREEDYETAWQEFERRL